MQFVSVKVLQSYQCLCDQIGKVLYFPLKNIYNTIVGYRKLFKNENNTIMESVYPKTNAFGLITTNNKLSTTNKQKSSTTAILVLTILDLLALSTHKTDGITINDW